MWTNHSGILFPIYSFPIKYAFLTGKTLPTGSESVWFRPHIWFFPLETALKRDIESSKHKLSLKTSLKAFSHQRRAKPFNPLTLLRAGFLRYCKGRGGVWPDPPLVSQLWDPKNSKTQFSQTDMVLSFHLSP